MLLVNVSQNKSKGLPKTTPSLQTGMPPKSLDAYRNSRADGVGFAQDDIREVRMYCNTSAHSRVAHFKTSNPSVRRLAWDLSTVGLLAQDFGAGFTTLSGHSTLLPKSFAWIQTGIGFAARLTGGAGTNEWRVVLYGNLTAYACDDGHKYGGGYVPTWTNHRVWVR